MNLPASAAGKKGKCPACGEVVQITSTAAENPSAGPLEIGPGPLSVTPQDTGADPLGLDSNAPSTVGLFPQPGQFASTPLGASASPVPSSRQDDPSPIKRRGKLPVLAHVLTLVISVVLSLVLGPAFLSNEQTGDADKTNVLQAEDGDGKLKEEVDRLGKSLKEVTAAIAQLDNRLTTAAGKDNAVDALARDLEAVQTTVEQIEGRLTDINNTNQELFDQFALIDVSRDSNASALREFEKSKKDERGNIVYLNYPDEYLLNSADFQFLQELTHLETLYIGSNLARGSDVKYLKGLSNLKELDLKSNPIKDTDLAVLTELPSLEELSLRETGISDAGLVHLKGISLKGYLHLGDTDITDAGLVHLKALTSLETLVLPEGQVSESVVAELKAALPNCRIEVR